MNKLARIASTLIALAAVTAFTAPALAAAKDAPPAAAADKGAPAQVDAAKLKSHLAAKVAKRRALVEKKMDQRNVPDATRVEIRKSMDELAAKLDAAVAQAAKDGVVSKEEAKEVRKVARNLHKDLAAKLKAHKLGKEKKEKGSKEKGEGKEQGKKVPRKRIEVKRPAPATST